MIADSASSAPESSAPPVAPASLLGSLRNLILLILPLAVGISYLGIWAQRAERDLLFEELLGQGSSLPYGYRYVGGTAVASEQRWLRITPGPESPVEAAGQPLPKVILICRYAAPLAAQRQFDLQGLPSGEGLTKKVESWNKDPNFSFDGLIGRGTIAFGAFETDYVHLRRYRPSDPPFELLRVNLTFGNTGQILEAHFAPEQANIQPDALLPFLAALALKLPEPPPAAPPAAR